MPSGTCLSLLLLLAAVPRPASAYDGAGPAPPPTDGELDDPLLSWSGRPIGPGRAALSAGFHLSESPIGGLIESADGELEYRSLIGLLSSVRIGGTLGLSERVSIGLTLPAHLDVQGDTIGSFSAAGGPGLGDLHLNAPIFLAGRHDSRAALAMVPVISLPTGDSGRLLGLPGVGAGGAVVASADLGPLRATGSFGGEYRRTSRLAQLQTGPRLYGTLGLGAPLSEGVRLYAESRIASFLPTMIGDVPEQASRARLPAEAQLGLRARLSPRLLLDISGGSALSPGVGAARLRLGAGLSVPLGQPRPASSTDAPTDSSGPTLRVLDRGGAPIEGAFVEARGEALGRTDLDGQIDLLRRRDQRELRVEAFGFVGRSVDRLPDDGQIVLDAQPVGLRLRVADPEGRPLDAEVSLRGPDGQERSMELGEGRAALDLLPGTWTLRVRAEGLAPQERTFLLRPGDEAIEAEVLLSEPSGDSLLDLLLLDPDGEPIDDVVLTLDGLPIGGLSAGIGARIEGLSEGAHTLKVEARGYLPTVLESVPISSEPLRVVMAPEAGSVEVIVRSPEGPVPDAIAYWVGATRLSDELGPSGRRPFQLRPGAWTLIVSSPTYGLQEREIVIDPDYPDRQRIEVTLLPPEGGEASLALRVIDPVGQPLRGAEVLLDGRPLGLTTGGGALRLAQLDTGTRSIAVGGPLLRPTLAEITLIPGENEQTVIVPYLPGATRILARHPSAMVPDAVGRFVGPSVPEPIPLGARGRAETVLDPGDWEAVVASPSFGLQQRSLAISPQDQHLHLVEAWFYDPSSERHTSELAISVLDPEGRPVAGASAALGEIELGRTGSGGDLHASGLGAGLHTLQVTAPMFATFEQRLRLPKGSLERQITLGWGAGAVRARVIDARGEPIPGALLRFAGERFVQPIPVGPDGTREVPLSPGPWIAVASSPDHGLAEVALELPESPGLTPIEIVLATPDDAIARVAVKVSDPDGAPVPKAQASFGSITRQIPFGGLTVVDLPPGDHPLSVSAPGYQSLSLPATTFSDGPHERVLTLDFVPIEVNVEVVGPDGSPVDATIRLDGPADHPGVRAAGGQAVLRLRPGTWSLTAEAADLGIARAPLQLTVGQEPAELSLTLRPRSVRLVDGELQLEQVIGFATNSDRIGAGASPLLDEVAATLIAAPELRRIEIAGHSDSIGGVAYNLDLSRRRAESVKRALVERGVAPERLVARGYGPTRPVRLEDTDEARAANRRVAFVVLP